ncbi:MAG: hypothetical protein JJE52_15015 [Acidimicrobiia bacterium]|nr:hypothetical protein [Acidimicrobiia bacterium]
MTQVRWESSRRWPAVAAIGLRLLAAVALVVAVLLAIDARPAGAHGGEGAIEVGEPTPAGDLTVTLPIRITYVADGHAAEEVGPLVVEGTGPGGATFGQSEPFVAGDAPGVFEASLVFPSEGSWELTITSTEPPASAPLIVDVAAAPVAPDEPAEDEDTDGVPSDDDTDENGDETETGADDTVGSGDPEVGGEARLVDEGDDDGAPVVAIVLGGLVLLAIIGGVVYWRRREAA